MFDIELYNNMYIQSRNDIQRSNEFLFLWSQFNSAFWAGNLPNRSGFQVSNVSCKYWKTFVLAMVDKCKSWSNEISKIQTSQEKLWSNEISSFFTRFRLRKSCGPTKFRALFQDFASGKVVSNEILDWFIKFYPPRGTARGTLGNIFWRSGNIFWKLSSGNIFRRSGNIFRYFVHETFFKSFLGNYQGNKETPTNLFFLM